MTDDWYNNKDLFEMFQGLQKDIQAMSIELKETRVLISKYNGLRKEIADMREEINKIKNEDSGKNKTLESIRNWGGWIVAVGVGLYKLFGG